jgi:hypothetical protein
MVLSLAEIVRREPSQRKDYLNRLMAINRLNSVEFQQQLKSLDAWLVSRGFTKRDRFRQHLASIGEMARREQTSGPAQLFADVQSEGRTTEILTANVESIEFFATLSALRSKNVSIPDELLRRALDGPADAFRESPKSNRGRNAMFELAMGAMVANQDLAPKMDGGNPDVEFVFRGRRVLMECKRVFSEKRILDNVADAIDQLEKCVDTSSSDLGLVAVSISRLATKGDGYWNTPSEEQGRAYLSEQLRRVVAVLDPSLEKLRSPCVAGIVFYVSGPMYVQDVGYTVMAASILYTIKPDERDVLMELAKTLRV